MFLLPKSDDLSSLAPIVGTAGSCFTLRPTGGYEAVQLI